MNTPGLGRIFSTTTTEDRETDIILTLTPRIIRIPDITEDDLATLWVGTEENMQLRGPARNALDQSPFSLPEGLRAGDSGADVSGQPPRRRGTLARIAPGTDDASGSRSTGGSSSSASPSPSPSGSDSSSAGSSGSPH